MADRQPQLRDAQSTAAAGADRGRGRASEALHDKAVLREAFVFLPGESVAACAEVCGTVRKQCAATAACNELRRVSAFRNCDLNGSCHRCRHGHGAQWRQAAAQQQVWESVYRSRWAYVAMFGFFDASDAQVSERFAWRPRSPPAPGPDPPVLAKQLDWRFLYRKRRAAEIREARASQTQRLTRLIRKPPTPRGTVTVTAMMANAEHCKALQAPGGDAGEQPDRPCLC